MYFSGTYCSVFQLYQYLFPLLILQIIIEYSQFFGAMTAQELLYWHAGNQLFVIYITLYSLCEGNTDDKVTIQKIFKNLS